jgi:LemA protein
MDSNLSQSLISVLEAYPQLATAQNVLDLQAAVSQSENQIAGARKGYNDAVEIARTKLESFPSSLFASRFTDRRAALWTC